MEITVTTPTSSTKNATLVSNEDTFSADNEKSLRIALKESSDLTLRVRPTADLYLKTIQVKDANIFKRPTTDQLFSNQNLQFGRSLSFVNYPERKTKQ